MRIIYTTAHVLLCIAILSACSRSTAVSSQQPTSVSVPTIAPAALATKDEIAIYTAVIRTLAGPDDTFGGQLKKAIIYIPRTPNNVAAKPGSTGAVSFPLSTAIQQGITQALADLSSQIVWVDRTKDVPLGSDTSRVRNDGVIIEVGAITFDGMHAFVPGSIYVANLAAGGTTYIVEQQYGEWIVSGTNGEMWISEQPVPQQVYAA